MWAGLQNSVPWERYSRLYFLIQRAFGVLSCPFPRRRVSASSALGRATASPPACRPRLPQGQVTVDGVGAGRLGAGSAAEGSAVHGACLERSPHGKDRLTCFECLPSSLPLAETQGNADR